jgi:hypothetical protein
MLFSKVTTFFSGRHTMFVVTCLTIGVTMSWFHKLDSNLVTLLLGLQALVTTHSTQENYFKKSEPGITPPQV